jgi:hypothetical protein
MCLVKGVPVDKGVAGQGRQVRARQQLSPAGTQVFVSQWLALVAGQLLQYSAAAVGWGSQQWLGSKQACAAAQESC